MPECRFNKKNTTQHHCKNDLKRHAHTLSGDAGADLQSRLGGAQEEEEEEGANHKEKRREEDPN